MMPNGCRQLKLIEEMFAAQIKRADLLVNDASNYVSEFTGAVRMENAGDFSRCTFVPDH